MESNLTESLQFVQVRNITNGDLKKIIRLSAFVWYCYRVMVDSEANMKHAVHTVQ